MLDYRITFDQPAYLALLAVIPLLWWIGRRSLAGMGRGRRWMALALRSLLVLLVVGALAEVQLVRSSDRLAVLYVVGEGIERKQTDFAAEVAAMATARA